MQTPTSDLRPDAVDAIRGQWHELRPDLDLEVIEIIGRIARTSALIVRASDLLLAKHQLTRGEFDILTALRRTGTPQSPGALRTVGLATGPATTKRLRSLVDRGFIERKTHPADGRSALIALTKAGTQLIDRAFPEVLDLEHQLLNQVPRDQWVPITDALRGVLASVETRVLP